MNATWKKQTSGVDGTDKRLHSLAHLRCPRFASSVFSFFFEQHKATFWLDGDQTQAARKGFVLANRNFFLWHFALQDRLLCCNIGYNRLLDGTIDLTLRFDRTSDKAIET